MTTPFPPAGPPAVAPDRPGLLHHVPIGGAVMRVTDVGDGPAVLLGHSFLWDAAMWRPQIAGLAATHRVIAPDLWGHGGSGALPVGATMRDLAAHHLALMDRLGVERFAVVGLSVGAMWGAELALMAPGRVTGLVMINSAASPEPEPKRLRYFAMLDAVEATGALPPAIADAVVPLFFSPALEAARPDLVAGFRAHLLRWDSARLVDSVVPIGRLIFGRDDRVPALAGLTLPRLTIASGEDRSRSVAEGLRTATGQPFVELPEAGHIATLETPDPLTGVLAGWLAALAAFAR